MLLLDEELASGSSAVWLDDAQPPMSGGRGGCVFTTTLITDGGPLHWTAQQASIPGGHCIACSVPLLAPHT